MLIKVADIGSNSIKASLYRIEGESLLPLRESRLALSLGVHVYGAGALGEGASREIADFLCVPEADGIKIDATLVMATAAVRDASNRQAFVSEIEARLGLAVKVLSGEEESYLIHKGMLAREEIRAGETVLTVDVGGGSVEFAWSRNGEYIFGGSCGLGAILLSRKFIGDDTFTRKTAKGIRQYGLSHLRQRFKKHRPDTVDRAFAGSGNIRAIGKMIQCMRGGPFLKIVPEITRGSLEDVLEAAMGRPALEISRLFDVGLDRARIVMPAVVVLHAAMEFFDTPRVAICEAGLRDGAAHYWTENGHLKLPPLPVP